MYKYKSELLILLIFLVAIIVISIFYYGQFTELGIEKVPIHWNINNQPDNFASPLLACLLGPATIILIILSSFGMSKKNFTNSEKRSTRFVILLVAALMVFINWVALKSAAGYANEQGFDMSMLHLGLGLVFILIGNQFGKLPRSHWIGIRVPATLNNDEVWNRVHRKSGKLMVISGAFVIAAMFLGDRPIAIFFYIPLFASIVLMIFIIPTIEKKRVEKEENSKKG